MLIGLVLITHRRVFEIQLNHTASWNFFDAMQVRKDLTPHTNFTKHVGSYNPIKSA